MGLEIDKDLYRKLLSRFPNNIVALMMNISRERARQIREQLGDLPDGKEMAQNLIELKREYEYIKLIESNGSLEGQGYKPARAFAEAHGLPWPPRKSSR